MDAKIPDFKKILQVLVAHGVEFVVIGGVAAVLQGAPIATFDLDTVHARNKENLDRLLSALEELKSFYRSLDGRKLRPTRSHLRTAGHQLLKKALSVAMLTFRKELTRLEKEIP